MAQLLDVVRTGLRRATTKLDETELIPMIGAAKLDLAAAGVSALSDDDPLTQMAIRLYCQWMIERDERTHGFYEAIKAGMSLDARYHGGVGCVE